MTRRTRGFTLLELLVVIGILGLLMSILVPSLSAARRHAKANLCLSHLKGIGTAFTVYLNENEDQFPPFRLKTPAPTTKEPYINDFGRYAPRWQWFLETDLGPVIDTTPFRSVIERTGYFHDHTFGTNMERGTTMSSELFACPSLDDDEFAMDVRDGAYGYNYQYLGNARQNADPTRWDNFSVGLHRIRNMGRTVLVADSRGAGRSHGRHSYTLDPPRRAIERNAMFFGPSRDTYDPRARAGDVPQGLDAEIYAFSPVEMRHTKRGNVLFVDSHAETMTLTQLGYQVSDGEAPAGVRKGVAVPIHEPMSETYTATNKMWNGDGFDRIADEHRPDSSGG